MLVDLRLSADLLLLVFSPFVFFLFAQSTSFRLPLLCSPSLYHTVSYTLLFFCVSIKTTFPHPCQLCISTLPLFLHSLYTTARTAFWYKKKAFHILYLRSKGKHICVMFQSDVRMWSSGRDQLRNASDVDRSKDQFQIHRPFKVNLKYIAINGFDS